MAKLWGRFGEVTVGTAKYALPGLAWSFSVERTLAPSPNKASVKLYNLSPNSRLLLQSYGKVPVRLDVGYQDLHGVIFEGYLRSVESKRDGADIVTEIRSGDGEDAYRAARVNFAIPKGASVDTVAKQIVSAMGLDPKNVAASLANLSLINGRNFSSGGVVHGNAARELTALCKSLGATWSIQSGAVQILKKGTALPQPAIKLSEATGLIGAPSISTDGQVKCQALIQPAIVPGCKIVVEAEFIQGQFIVQKATYTGATNEETPWYVDIEGKRY